ncbi:hypothetical protein ACH5RR_038233 [Cinchona calisaya]|uniref:Starch synthase, chloroplastic/amyloplastic n=1 Tax=Cinchona calisaya TaxID=153742 RepID=A0ABD2XYT1_9GENT
MGYQVRGVVLLKVQTAKSGYGVHVLHSGLIRYSLLMQLKVEIFSESQVLISQEQNDLSLTACRIPKYCIICILLNRNNSRLKLASVMATVTASHFVSRSSNGHHPAAAPCADARTNLGLRNHPTVTHNGLRAVNLQPARANAAKGLLKKSTHNSRHSETIICGKGANLVFVGAEVAPWSKTGGLGDVLGGLPPAMAANGHRVMTVSPRYDQYKDGWDTRVLVVIKVGDRIEVVRFFHCYKHGVDRVFVDHPVFLEKVWGKTESKIYGPNAGDDYQDNQLRFSLLCQAALEAPRVLSLNNSKYFSGPYGTCSSFGIMEFYCITETVNCKQPCDKPVKGRKISWMKAGILESDRVLTVSPYYAQELVSSIEKGVEFDNILRKTRITGIVNGMDTQEWNPATDKYISVNYDTTTVMDVKPLLKEALQAAVGLPVDRNIPLIGFIGRLEEQKGSDILAAAIPKFIHMNVQIVILGTGKKNFEKQIEQLEVMYPDQARGVAKFSVPLAHMIIAGADFMLVPSRFEPCGLIQLHALCHGTVPICASTGGLVDTVKEGYTGFHMGAFSVQCDAVDPADVLKIVETVSRALTTYGILALKEMIRNCMSRELSWKGPAKKWETMLLGLGVSGSEAGVDAEEIAPLAKENVATPRVILQP